MDFSSHLACGKWKEIPIELSVKTDGELRRFRYDSHRYTEVLLFPSPMYVTEFILLTLQTSFYGEQRQLEKKEMPYFCKGHVCLP